MKKLNVLVACEESQAVCKAFRKLGHNAFSCDLISCSGGHPEWHIISNALFLIGGKCHFYTEDDVLHSIDSEWDLIIAHPPCTYLTSSGNRWFDIDKYGEKAIQRLELQLDSAYFFMSFLNANCKHICVENPVGFMNSHYRKPDQIIHPFLFGHPTSKATCFWLEGLPNLIPTNIVEIEYVYSKTGRKWVKWFYDTSKITDKKERSKIRSKTFPGIAEAMAIQWSKYILDNDYHEVNYEK